MLKNSLLGIYLSQHIMSQIALPLYLHMTPLLYHGVDEKKYWPISLEFLVTKERNESIYSGQVFWNIFKTLA